MSRIRILCFLAASIFLTPESRTLAQSSSSDPYKLIVVNSPGSYWGYVRPKTPIADIIDSQGQYLINVQQASMLREKVRQERFVTAKKELEFWVWRDKFIEEALEAKRELIKKKEITRAVDDPPGTEIYYGDTLNTLLKELFKYRPLKEPSTKIEPDCLAHIHVRSQSDRGLGILQQDKVFWPQLLDIAFPDKCEQIKQKLALIKEQAFSSRGVNQADLLALRRELDDLKTSVDNGGKLNPHDVLWSPDNQIGASRRIGEIKQTVLTLKNTPDAAIYLRPLKAQSVSELVEHMHGKGLLFAPAMAGDDRYYVILRSSLADELRRVRPPKR